MTICWGLSGESRNTPKSQIALSVWKNYFGLSKNDTFWESLQISDKNRLPWTVDAKIYDSLMNLTLVRGSLRICWSATNLNMSSPSI